MIAFDKRLVLKLANRTGTVRSTVGDSSTLEGHTSTTLVPL